MQIKFTDIMGAALANMSLWTEDMPEAQLRSFHSALETEMLSRGFISTKASGPVLPIAMDTAEEAMVRGGDRISAIKHLRARLAPLREVGLKDAKDIIDSYQDRFLRNGGRLSEHLAGAKY